MSNIQKAVVRERRIKLIFLLSGMLTLFLTVTQTKNLLVSVLLAFVGYYLLAPAVDFLERKGLSRTFATAVPFLFVIVTMTVLGQIFIPVLIEQFSGFQGKLPQYADAASKLLMQFELKASAYLSPISSFDLRGQIEPSISLWTKSLFEQLPQYLSSSLTVLLLSPFLAFFILVDGRDFLRKALALVPNNLFELALNLNHQVSSQMGGFIRARLLESIIVSICIWLGLFSLGFPYSLVLAIFAGVMNVIPYLGPVFGALPAVIISFANGGNSSDLLFILAIYGGAQVLDTVVIVPFVVAKIVNLHPVTVVLAVLIGSQFMGILGMIISIPVFSALKVSSIALYRHFTDFRA